jgi:hypothetical protein
MNILLFLLATIYGLNNPIKNLISKYKTYNIIFDSKNITSSVKFNCKKQLNNINKTIISKIDKNIIDKDSLHTYYIYCLFFILID